MKRFKVYTMGRKGIGCTTVTANSKEEALAQISSRVVVRAFEVNEIGVVCR